jgi:hypothetical protein
LIIINTNILRFTQNYFKTKRLFYDTEKLQRKISRSLNDLSYAH